MTHPTMTHPNLTRPTLLLLLAAATGLPAAAWVVLREAGPREGAPGWPRASTPAEGRTDGRWPGGHCARRAFRLDRSAVEAVVPVPLPGEVRGPGWSVSGLAEGDFGAGERSALRERIAELESELDEARDGLRLQRQQLEWLELSQSSEALESELRLRILRDQADALFDGPAQGDVADAVTDVLLEVAGYLAPRVVVDPEDGPEPDLGAIDAETVLAAVGPGAVPRLAAVFRDAWTEQALLPRIAREWSGHDGAIEVSLVTSRLAGNRIEEAARTRISADDPRADYWEAEHERLGESLGRRIEAIVGLSIYSGE